MKKIFTAAMALTLALTMGATALAAGIDGAALGDQYIDVKAKYNDGATVPDIYSVDLTWDDMTFSYNESGTRIWDSTTHTYTESLTTGWDKSSAIIKATNHSNQAVTLLFSYTALGETGITGSMSQGSFTLDAGVEGKPNEADSDVTTLHISGTPNETVTAEGITVGTITVTIV